MRIHNHGQIRSIDIPEDWQERAPTADPSQTIILRTFHAHDSPDTQIRLVYRGRLLTAAAGNTFRAALDRDPHELDEKEVEALAAIIWDVTDDGQFDITQARTRDLNGKRILLIEGTYKRQPYSIMTVFVDADGSGRAVQEITCFAPTEHYGRYQKDFSQALVSIEWLSERGLPTRP